VSPAAVASAGSFAVTSAVTGAGHRWSALDVLHFPDEAALLQAMLDHYTDSRLPHWTKLLTLRGPVGDEPVWAAQCDALSNGRLTAAQAMPLLAGWLMRAVRAAAQLPDRARIRGGIDESAWSQVLDDVVNDADDKLEETQRWAREPVWLCVHQSTPDPSP